MTEGSEGSGQTASKTVATTGYASSVPVQTTVSFKEANEGSEGEKITGTKSEYKQSSIVKVGDKTHEQSISDETYDDKSGCSSRKKKKVTYNIQGDPYGFDYDSDFGWPYGAYGSDTNHDTNHGVMCGGCEYDSDFGGTYADFDKADVEFLCGGNGRDSDDHERAPCGGYGCGYDGDWDGMFCGCVSSGPDGDGVNYSGLNDGYGSEGGSYGGDCSDNDDDGCGYDSDY